MALKAFYAFLALLIGFLAYNAITLSAAKRSLTQNPAEYVLGNPNGDLTVVEYLDYTCIYCQRMHPIILEAVQNDGNVKYEPRPLLSANKDGSTAAYLFYAAAMGGRAQQAHDYLMGNAIDLTMEKIPQIATEIGLDPEVMDANLKSTVPHKAVKSNMKTVSALKARGTPTFFIGPDIMYLPEEMPTAEDFQALFNQAREEG